LCYVSKENSETECHLLGVHDRDEEEALFGHFNAAETETIGPL
jgi:hypothetical protein